MEKNKNKKYDYVIDLDITAPLRKTQDIRSAFEQIVSTKVDVVFSVVPARRNPYFNMVERDEKGKIVFSKPVAYTCRQDAPEVYDMNASIYCYDRNTLIDTSKDPFDEKIEIIIMPEVYVVDIDHEEDFNVMECLLKKLKRVVIACFYMVLFEIIVIFLKDEFIDLRNFKNIALLLLKGGTGPGSYYPPTLIQIILFSIIIIF